MGLGGKMKIQYLDDAPYGYGENKDVMDVPDVEAAILIRLGYAKEVKETKPKRTKTETEAESEL